MSGKVEPLISFVIPFYNDHSFLDDCLQSIVQHTSCSYEVILVDDASPDTSFHSDLVSPVTLLRNETQRGASVSRNRGINSAKGKYICFLDSDDELSRDPAELITSATRIAGEQSIPKINLIVGRFSERDGHQPSQVILRERTDTIKSDSSLIQLNDFSTVLYQRGWLVSQNIRFATNLTYSEDVLFLLECIVKAEQVCVTGLDFYLYRQRPNSVSNTGSSVEKLRDRLIFFEKMAEAIAPLNSAAPYRLVKAYKWNIRLLIDIADQLSGQDLREILSEKSRLYRQYLRPKGLKASAKLFGFSWDEPDEKLLNLFHSCHLEQLMALVKSGELDTLFKPFTKR